MRTCSVSAGSASRGLREPAGAERVHGQRWLLAAPPARRSAARWPGPARRRRPRGRRRAASRPAGRRRRSPAGDRDSTAGSRGRKRMARAWASTGNSRAAWAASSPTIRSDEDRSKPTRSRLAPISTVPLAVPSMTVESLQAGRAAGHVGHVVGGVDLVPDQHRQRLGDHDEPAARQHRQRQPGPLGDLPGPGAGRVDDEPGAEQAGARSRTPATRPAAVSARSPRAGTAARRPGRGPGAAAGRPPSSAGPACPRGSRRRRPARGPGAAPVRPGRRAARPRSAPRPRPGWRRTRPGRRARRARPRRPGRPWGPARRRGRARRPAPATAAGTAGPASSSGPGSLSEIRMLPSPAPVVPDATVPRSATATRSPARAR